MVARSTFLQAVERQKEVHNGVEHMAYPATAEGFAYFLSKDWQRGSVRYDGVLYEGEMLLYDMVRDKLVVRRPDGFAIEVRREKVDWFALASHLFVYMDGSNGLKPGFYDRLAVGAVTLLARRGKQLEDQIEDTRVRQTFTEQVAYYALAGNTIHPIRNLRSLLDVVPARAGAAQQHLKRNGIKYKRNREAALAAAAAFFNQTQN